MDTRSKIADAADFGLRGPRLAAGEGGLVAVTGYFDPLLAWHACELARIRERAGALAVILLPLAGELLSPRARAEMVAALRMVDYVLIAENGDLDRVVAGLNPAEIVRLDDADLRRRGELMDDLRGRPAEESPRKDRPRKDRPGGLSHIE